MGWEEEREIQSLLRDGLLFQSFSLGSCFIHRCNHTISYSFFFIAISEVQLISLSKTHLLKQ